MPCLFSCHVQCAIARSRSIQIETTTGSGLGLIQQIGQIRIQATFTCIRFYPKTNKFVIGYTFRLHVNVYKTTEYAHGTEYTDQSGDLTKRSLSVDVLKLNSIWFNAHLVSSVDRPLLCQSKFQKTFFIGFIFRDFYHVLHCSLSINHLSPPYT